MSPLFKLAIASGRVETVRSHLERGADANARDNSGCPALILAASRGRQDICEILLAHGADPHAEDAGGRSLSHYAREWDFVDFQSGLTDVGQSAAALKSEPSTEGELRPAVVFVEPEPEPAAIEVPVTLPVPAVTQPTEFASSRPAAPEVGDVENEYFGWEAEPEQFAPDEDAVRVVAAVEAHDVFSRPRANIDISDWSGISLYLPASVQAELPAPPGSIVALLAEGIESGRVGPERIFSAVPPGKAASGLAMSLRFLLSDLGVAVRSSPFEDMLWSEAPPAPVSPNDYDLPSDISEYLEALSAPDIEARYIAETQALRQDALSLQPILWSRAEELRRRIAAAFASLPGGVAALEAAGASFSAESADEVAQLIEPDGTDDDDADELDAGMPSREAEVLPIPGDLADLTEQQVADRLFEMRIQLPVLQRAVATLEARGEAGSRGLRMMTGELEVRLSSIVRTNLTLVTWFARRYPNRGLDYLDIVQEGNLGLIRAVQKFDPSRGASLGTYAVWWVRQAMTRAIADLSRTIRVPVHVQDDARRLQRMRQSLQVETGVPPDAADVARKMEMSANAVSVLERRTEQFVSDRGDNVGRLRSAEAASIPDPGPGPDIGAWHSELKRLLDSRLAELDPRQARVLRLRFGMDGHDEHTLEEVGQLYGVTRERIRQIEAKALKILAHPSRSQVLKVFLHA